MYNMYQVCIWLGNKILSQNGGEQQRKTEVTTKLNPDDVWNVPELSSPPRQAVAFGAKNDDTPVEARFCTVGG